MSVHPTSIDSPAAPHTTNRKYLRQLDGIRAVAVLSVVLFHTKVPFFANGYIGVDVFFVLSGYLITGILLDEFDRTDRIAFGRFYLRRALRLLPALLFLALALVTAYALLLPPEERRESLLPVLAAVGYATSPLAASGMDLGSMLHAWSLSVEEYFYFVLPVVLLIAVRAFGRRRILTVLAVITLTAIAYRFAVAWTDWSTQRIYYAADTRAEQLLIGCLLAALLKDRAVRVPGAVAGCAAIALAGFVTAPAGTMTEVYRYGGSTVVALSSAAIIAYVATIGASPATRILATAPLWWIGVRSYAIYLWHPPVAALLARVAPDQLPVAPTVLVATLIIAGLSYRFIETPFLRLKDPRPTASVRHATGDTGTAGHTARPSGPHSSQTDTT